MFVEQEEILLELISLLRELLDLALLFTKDLIDNGHTTMEHATGVEIVADPLTKVLPNGELVAPDKSCR